VRSINHGFENEELSVTQRQGVITCIPKEEKPKQYLKNWRPISLLNVAYKIASSCIANRLKMVLPNIIHEDQKGFMKGRYIGENIRRLYDLLLYTEKEQIPGLLLMIDFEKAFDSVSWSFIQKALDRFNFGPDIKRWIRTFYAKATSCVSVNGQYSKWFNIRRGVRQGDPCSPYIYLICAEILSVMIRQNAKIKGININEQEILLSQFADDTTLSLDGSEESLRECIKTLKAFTLMSGLRMNNDKTQIVWIGSRKNCKVRFMRDMNFCWDPGIFKVLGIKFSTDTERIAEINYDGKLTEIQKILNNWEKRQLTPFGKVTVIKALVVSKLVHLFINVPDPSVIFLKELETMLFKFLWGGKPHKIKKDIVCKSYKEGGLRMFDVFSFLAAMKISWLSKISRNSSLKDFCLTLYPSLGKLNMLGSEYCNVIMQRIHNPFWKDVLRHYKKLCLKCSPTNVNEFVLECIYYNENIKRERKVIFVKEWFDAGIVYVHQLVKADGSYLSLDEFRTQFPVIVNTSFLLYGGVINAIKEYQEKCRLEALEYTGVLESKVWSTIGKGNRCVQSMMSCSGNIPAAVIKWNGVYVDLAWEKIFSHAFESTADMQLRWFQTRLLHRLLPTSRYLFLRKLKDSPLCVFCISEEETLSHLFWQCRLVSDFWRDLKNFLDNNCVHTANFIFSEELVLFGIQRDTKTDKSFDLILLLAKFYIYKCKLQECLPVLGAFKNILKFRYNIEKYSACARRDVIKFNRQWWPYLSLVN
jgi:hypothetical protein